VLAGLGTSCDEAQVRQLIGHTRSGVSLVGAQARLAQAGAAAAWHADWNLTDLRDVLRAGHFPIVGVERQPLGYPRAFHAVVLVKITNAGVEALDPLEGPEPRRYGVAAFTQAWELAGREALLIESPPGVA
jgi:ABC-type bacteriocin/lantibiotic exporter with double-glycine peptidase domain